MTHERKRGDKASYPICVWSGILDHYSKIGPAIWEFLWLIDAITLEEDGIGWVYGKNPFKIARIVGDLVGTTRRTVERNLARLKDGGYIIERKARYGIVVGVVNSRKIRPRRSFEDTPKMAELAHRHAKNGGTDMPKMAELDTKNGGTGDSILNDNAVRQSSKTAEAACPVWKETGVDPLRLPGPFRKHCEEHWRFRDGAASLFDFMGTVLDAWNALGNSKYPPAWVRRKAEIGRSAPVKPGPEPPELESIPWQR